MSSTNSNFMNDSQDYRQIGYHESDNPKLSQLQENIGHVPTCLIPGTLNLSIPNTVFWGKVQDVDKSEIRRFLMFNRDKR